MYQVLHDTNNVTESGCHCVSADHSSSLQGCWQWQCTECCFKFRTVYWGPVFEIKLFKSRDFEIGQWGRPWLVLYVPCKRRCVPRFTKLKHRHRQHWSSLTLWNSLSRNSVTVSRWSARRYFHCLRRTITRITDTMTVKCVTTIPCIDPADLSINISD